MIHQNFVFIGIILQSIGGIGYLIDTVTGKVQPNRVSWFLWSLAPLIAFYAQIRQGVGNEALVTFIVGFEPLIVLIATFFNKKAQWKIQKLDIICGILSLLGIALWLVTKIGNVAILFCILADGLAAVPTIVKSWHEPESESSLIYFMGFINSIIGLLVIRNWQFENYAFLLYLTAVGLLLFVLIQFKIGASFKKMLQ